MDKVFTTNPSSEKHKFLLGLDVDAFAEKVKNLDYDAIEEEQSKESVESVESSDSDQRYKNAKRDL